MADDRPSGDFSLFDTEERVLAEAETMIRQLHDVAGGVRTLADAYRKSYREQRRLVRLSDRMQHELQIAKQNMAEQAQHLQKLNEILTDEAEKRIQLTEELLKMATTDPLTGTASRRHLFELGGYEILKIARTGEPMAALMADLDNFKRVNDTYGHLAGDEVLRHFADICTKFTRKSDIVARYGGEEFVILLPNTLTDKAVEIAERIRTGVATVPVPTEAGQISFTVSIGIARIEPGDISLERLLSRADTALYEAKRAGRNRVVVNTAAAAIEP